MSDPKTQTPTYLLLKEVEKKVENMSQRMEKLEKAILELMDSLNEDIPEDEIMEEEHTQSSQQWPTKWKNFKK